MFKLWSESNPEVLNHLKPDLWLRSWDELSAEEKKKIWKYIEEWFFYIDDKEYNRSTERHEYEFPSKGVYFDKHTFSLFIQASIHKLNETYKHKTYWAYYIKWKDSYSACLDFIEIFNNWKQDVVLELLSIYALVFINWSKDKFKLHKKEEENQSDYESRLISQQYYYFDKFVSRINDVFVDFWLKWELTRVWFWPRQSEEITLRIYEPTLKILSDKKFFDVNRDLWDAFTDYQKKDYSWCITKTISAIQAFLQVSVRWEIGKGDIAELINEAIKNKLIPDDIFTKTIFDNIKSVVMRERQITGDSHPKIEYANEQNARLILNISMVFIQHFIQLQK